MISCSQIKKVISFILLISIVSCGKKNDSIRYMVGYFLMPDFRSYSKDHNPLEVLSEKIKIHEIKYMDEIPKDVRLGFESSKKGVKESYSVVMYHFFSEADSHHSLLELKKDIGDEKYKDHLVDEAIEFIYKEEAFSDIVEDFIKASTENGFIRVRVYDAKGEVFYEAPTTVLYKSFSDRFQVGNSTPSAPGDGDEYKREYAFVIPLKEDQPIEVHLLKNPENQYELVFWKKKFKVK